MIIEKFINEWSQSYPIQPLDNICVYPFIKLKRFRPSYEREPRPNMSSLLNWEYHRTWQKEHDAYIKWRNERTSSKKIKHDPNKKPWYKTQSKDGKPKWIP